MRDPFPRVDGLLRAGSTTLEELADRYGSPLYVYDADHVRGRLEEIESAFAGVDLLVAYSVKANGSLGLLNRIGATGAGADIVSAGELHRALAAGIPGGRIVFAGVGKTTAEMEDALRAGIYAFNVESEPELWRLAGVAEGLGIPAPVALRVNPDILSPTPHEYTRTGHAASKFGIPIERAPALYAQMAGNPHLDVRGIDVHIGSQIVDPDPYRAALTEVLRVVDQLAEQGIPLEFVDLGGGYGVAYGADERRLALDELAAAVVPALRERNLRLILEPGRFVVGQAGVLVTRVLYLKESGGKTFVITDGGMTELLRPSHYGGYHRIDPVRDRPDAEVRTVDVVGPICESGDFLAQDRALPLPEPGDLLAVRTSGAYGFTMALNYNGRLRPPEVMVEGDQVHLIRHRENLDDLVRGEVIPGTS